MRADGSGCTTCVNAIGGIVVQDCGVDGGQTPDVLQCGLLVMPLESCAVCVDDDGALQGLSCRNNAVAPGNCQPGQACAEAVCTLQTRDDGDVCRTCSVAGAAADESCVGDATLTCVSSTRTNNQGCVQCTDGGAAAFSTCS